MAASARPAPGEQVVLETQPGMLQDIGFGIYEKPPPYDPSVQWQIYGDESQIVEIQLKPGEYVSTEPGTMVHMTNGLKAKIHTAGGCFQACKRCCCMSETFCRVRYDNDSPSTQNIGLTPNFPAKIYPLDLSRFSGMTIKSRAFLAAVSEDPDFDVYCASGCCAGCCGGQGFLLNRISGEKQVFLNASGTILQKTLAPGEVLLADGASVVAFEKTVEYDVRRVGGCLMCCCGGEGLTNTVLRGPGVVIIQSMPIEKMARAIVARAPGGGGGGGGGS